MKKFLFALAALLCLQGVQAQPIPDDPDFQAGRLDNGMR